MKICIVYSSLGKGGAERTIVNLSNYLCGIYGDSVSIVLISTDECHYPMTKDAKIYALNEGRATKSVWGAVEHEVVIIGKLRKTIQEIKPDVILAFSCRWFLTSKLATLGTEIKIVGSERSNPKTTMKSRLNRVLVNLTAKFCDGFVFPTAGAKKCYPAAIQGKSVVIPNGIDLPNVTSDSGKRTSGYSICSAGRLIPGKRYDVLLQAFALIKKQFPEATLTIYGEGRSKGELVEQTEKLGVAEWVEFAGFRADFYQCLRQHDLFVYCSESESWGNVLAEALCCGMPCISSDYEFGARDMIIDGETGILVPVGDEQALAAAIVELMNAPDQRERMGENAAEHMKQFDCSAIVKRYRDYLETIMKR